MLHIKFFSLYQDLQCLIVDAIHIPASQVFIQNIAYTVLEIQTCIRNYLQC